MLLELLELPEIKGISESSREVAEQLINSLWHRYSHDLGSTSYPFWIDRFNNEREANKVMLKLYKQGMIKTSVVHNFSIVELNENYLLSKVSKETLNKIIIDSKVSKYFPIFNEDTTSEPQSTMTKLQSGIKESGLRRDGFAQAGLNPFQYDTKMMLKYRSELIRFSIKSMKKMEEKLNRSLRNNEGFDYQSIIEKVIDLIIKSPNEEYILGKLVMDSRGRAIYECLKTIFNPISNKMARALVVSPRETVNSQNTDSAYLFIAELCYGFNGDIPDKLEKGKSAYKDRFFHDLDTDTEHGLDDMFENIWLERLYDELDALAINPNHEVTTPLEVDFSSSNMVIIGLLLGHAQYVDQTKYMWQVDGLTKNHVKFAQTPYVFGSSAGVKSLWTKNKLSFTDEQVVIMKKAQTTGKFAIANELKDIIINHCSPKETMQLQVNREQFMVECNKTRNVGETTKQYIVLDEKGNFQIIQHTNTHKVPDVKQFKRYFVTGLI